MTKTKPKTKDNEEQGGGGQQRSTFTDSTAISSKTRETSHRMEQL